MSRRSNSTLIGAFITAGVVMFVFAVLILSRSDFFSKKMTFFSFFDMPLDGLDIGSSVKFKGVTVGSVKKIEIVCDDITNEATTLVQFEVNADLFRTGKGTKLCVNNYKTFYLEQISKGLAAKLSMENLLTGKLYVGLDYYGRGKKAYSKNVDADGICQMPTVPTEIEELKNSVMTVMRKISDIDIAGISDKISELLSGTKDKISKLDVDLINYAMASIADVLAPDSSTRQSLDKCLQQATKMMRTLRVFVDFLDRNPNALIAGKAQ